MPHPVLVRVHVWLMGILLGVEERHICRRPQAFFTLIPRESLDYELNTTILGIINFLIVPACARKHLRNFVINAFGKQNLRLAGICRLEGSTPLGAALTPRFLTPFPPLLEPIQPWAWVWLLQQPQKVVLESLESRLSALRLPRVKRSFPSHFIHPRVDRLEKAGLPASGTNFSTGKVLFTLAK